MDIMELWAIGGERPVGRDVRVERDPASRQELHRVEDGSQRKVFG